MFTIGTKGLSEEQAKSLYFTACKELIKNGEKQNAIDILKQLADMCDITVEQLPSDW